MLYKALHLEDFSMKAWDPQLSNKVSFSIPCHISFPLTKVTTQLLIKETISEYLLSEPVWDSTAVCIGWHVHRVASGRMQHNLYWGLLLVWEAIDSEMQALVPLGRHLYRMTVPMQQRMWFWCKVQNRNKTKCSLKLWTYFDWLIISYVEHT